MTIYISSSFSTFPFVATVARVEQRFQLEIVETG